MRIILETERVYLRELTPDDAESFWKLNADPEVIGYTGDEPFESVEVAHRFLEQYDHYRKYGFGRWAVILKSDHTFLGWCGLKYTEEKQEVDVGYRFFRKYWGMGYATESARACNEYGFKEIKLSAIVGRSMKSNTASVKVLEKIGMTFDRYFDFNGVEGMIFCIRNPYRNES